MSQREVQQSVGPPRAVKVGDLYGRLTVLADAGASRHRHRLLLCRCACGETRVVVSNSLRSGNTKSCGCLSREQSRKGATKHGDWGTPEWRAWRAMQNRCHNPNADSWRWYGARGIKVCKRWRESYEAFLADMDRRPSARHSLDRIDNDGNYTPGNCRWATPRQQANNRRPRRKR